MDLQAFETNPHGSCDTCMNTKKSMTNWPGIFATTLLTFSMTACAGTHLYDGTKDKLATEVKETYTKVNLTEVVADHRSNLESMLALELALVTEDAALHRDQILLDIIRYGKVGVLVPNFSKNPPSEPIAENGSIFPYASYRMQNGLGIKSHEALFKVALGVRGTSMGKRAKMLLEGDITDLKDYDWSPAKWEIPECTSDPKVMDLPLHVIKAIRDNKTNDPDGAEKDFRNLFDDYKKNCKKILGRSLAIFADLPTTDLDPKGEIRQTSDLLKKVKKDLDEEIKWGEDAKKELKKAAGKYEAIVKNLKEDENSRKKARKKIQNIANTISDILEGTKAGEKVLGIQIVSDNKSIDAIDALISATATGELNADAVKNDPKLAQAVVIATAIPELAEDLGALTGGTAQANPNLSKLLIEKARRQVNRDYAAKRIELARERVDLIQKRLEALLREVYYFNNIYQHVNTYRKSFSKSAFKEGACGGGYARADEVHLISALTCKKLDVEGRVALYQALTAYTNSVTIARATQRKIDHQLIHLDHLVTATVDEFALNGWDAIIGTPVDLIQAYHASGIKAEELAELTARFLSVGALGAIAAGVN